MRELSGKVAVVTGAASGIGLAIATTLVSAGARVMLVDRDVSLVVAETERLRESGGDVAVAVADVSDPEAVDKVATAAIAQFGAINIAVNNAGVVNGGNSWELSLEEWHRVLDINLWGVIHGIRSFVPRMLESGSEGHVVNTASMAAVIARPKLGPYTVAKHGILGLSDVLRAELQELGAPIGVSVVMPGMIKTGMNPIGTVSADDVAANVLDAIRNDRPYVFTDDHSTADVQSRLQSIIAARDEVL